MPGEGDSDVEKLTVTERVMPRDKSASERERETETVDVGSGLDTPNHERTPMAEDGKEEKKKEKPPLDSNVYSTKKTVAQGMMDLALLTSNASQLKMLLKYSDQKGSLFAAHVACLSLSILLQVIVGVLLIVNSRYNINRPSHHSRADLMNNATVVGVFLITVVIVGILLILKSRYNINRTSDQGKADRMNNITVIGIFLITVLNVLATSFDEGRIVSPYDNMLVPALDINLASALGGSGAGTATESNAVTSVSDEG